MNAWAVCGLGNDLSEPVESVWTEEAKAVERCDQLNQQDRERYPNIPHYGTHWKVKAFMLNMPDQDFN